MKSIILDFEGEKVEIPFYVSDSLALSTPNAKYPYKGILYMAEEKIISNIEEYANELRTWDRNSSLQNEMSIIYKMKKV